MLNKTIRTQAEQQILAVLDSKKQDLARLRVLAEQPLPVVTVVGKYNHGKSRLLNELIGVDTFSVADKRETTQLSSYTDKNLLWLDAPGLDADSSSQDDEYAQEALWLRSDIRLMVHTAKEGELDAAEQQLVKELLHDANRTQRQSLFILSQIDQLADNQELVPIVNAIEQQHPGLSIHAISSTRHRQGVAQSKNLFIEKSGIPALKIALNKAIQNVPKARAHETALLLQEIHTELIELQQQQSHTLAELKEQQIKQRQSFDHDWTNTLAKVTETLQEVIDAPPIDHSLTPDSMADMFKLTAGKQERSRLQVAYSKACIHISAFLAQHGATALPTSQRTAATNLNTVIIAVLGISVKYRKDLQRIFFEPTGRAQLQQDFAHYYEQSEDRVQLNTDINDVDKSLHATQQALHALEQLKREAKA